MYSSQEDKYEASFGERPQKDSEKLIYDLKHLGFTEIEKGIYGTNRSMEIPYNFVVVHECYAIREVRNDTYDSILDLCTFKTIHRFRDIVHTYYYFKTEYKTQNYHINNNIQVIRQGNVPIPLDQFTDEETSIGNIVSVEYEHANKNYANDEERPLEFAFLSTKQMGLLKTTQVIDITGFDWKDALDIVTGDGKVSSDDVKKIITLFNKRDSNKQEIQRTLSKIKGIEKISKEITGDEDIEVLAHISVKEKECFNTFTSIVKGYNRVEIDLLGLNKDGREVFIQNEHNLKTVFDNNRIFDNVGRNSRNAGELIMLEHVEGITDRKRFSKMYHCNDIEIIKRSMTSLFTTVFGTGLKYSNSIALYQLLKEHMFRTIDPVKYYFEHLKWDRKQRLGTWLGDTMVLDKSDDNRKEYINELGQLIIECIVARNLMEPGDQIIHFDYLPLFIGKENAGKTELCKKLALEPFLYSKILTFKDKEKDRKFMKSIVIDLPEALVFNEKGGEELIKDLISSTSVDHRTLYNEALHTHPIRYVVFGNANKTPPLYSQSQRRICKIEIKKLFDLNFLDDNIEQIYAEAVHLYKDKKESNKFNNILTLSERSTILKSSYIITQTDKRLATCLSIALEEIYTYNYEKITAGELGKYGRKNGDVSITLEKKDKDGKDRNILISVNKKFLKIVTKGCEDRDSVIQSKFSYTEKTYNNHKTLQTRINIEDGDYSTGFSNYINELTEMIRPTTKINKTNKNE